MRVYHVYIPKKYATMNTLPTNVLYDIYCPKSDGSIILLGWSSINARQILSVSRATIVLQIRESLHGHCRSQPGVESADTGE